MFAGPASLSTTVDYPNVVYFCAVFVGLGPYSAGDACSKSLDGGLTWRLTGQPPFLAFDPSQPRGNHDIPGFCGGATGHGVVGPDGAVYLPKGYCRQPWLAISHNEGATWTRVQVADNGKPQAGGVFQHDGSVAVDGDGNLYYSWAAADRLPYLSVSRDGGKTWSHPNMVAPRGVTEAWIPNVDVGAPGKVAIS